MYNLLFVEQFYVLYFCCSTVYSAKMKMYTPFSKKYLFFSIQTKIDCSLFIHSLFIFFF
ncbi:hypothetical protein CHCC20327_0913 [Bacillus licheniformis]|nr:hypothetical protein CHCC20327_0913 [Bacillus licheniformis]